MARIPLQVASPRLETGRPVDYSGVARSPVGAALQGFGADLQAVADHYRAQQEQAEDFEAVQGFNRMKIAADGDLTDIAQKAPPSGQGFHDNAMGAFQKRQAEFISSVPERLRPKFQQLIDTERAQFSQQQAGAELKVRNDWYRDGLQKAVGRGQEQVYNNPAALDAAKQEAIREIDASGLPDAEKVQWREKVDQGLATSLAARTMEEDPNALMGMLGIATQPVSLPNDPSLPAGMRNNNPGNIKFVGQGRDQGVVGPSKNTDQGDPQAVFATPEAGMAALYKLAKKKYDGGKTTANSLIAGKGGWTPGNMQAAANIARTMGIDPDADLNLADPARAQSFVRALVRQEHGKASDAYSDDMIAAAVGAKQSMVFADRQNPGVSQGYLQVASAFLGAQEGRDGGALAEFIKKSTGTALDPRQTAWCAAYVNAVLGSQGVQGTGSLAARSFLDFGETVEQPSMGDIVVLSRGGPGQGHVGFFAGYGPNGEVKVLGGNQSGGQVSVSSFAADKVLGFRRPPNVGTSEEANARLAKLPGGGPSGGMVVTQLDPRFASLPFADRLKLASQARQQAAARAQLVETQRKAEYSAYTDRVGLEILTGNVANEETILLDPMLQDSDKATLLRSYRTQQKEASTTDLAVQEYIGGGMGGLNPLDTDQSSKANKVYDVLTKNLQGAPIEAQQAMQQQFIQRTNIIPDPVVATLRKGQFSTNPQEFAQAMDEAGRIKTYAPVAFDKMAGGEDLRRDLTSFQSMVNDRGMSAPDAAKRIIDRRSEEGQRNEKILGPAADKAVKDLTTADITRDFAKYWFGFGSPGAGVDPTTQNKLLGEYQEAFREEFIRAGGDATEAKAQANRLLQKTWGVSEISGERQLMKYPPEKFYPALDDSYSYLRDDALATAASLLGEQRPEGEALAPAGTDDASSLRPLTPGEFRANGDGTFSTEVTTTIQDADGKWVNVPTLWRRDSGWVDLGEDEDAIAETVAGYEAGGQKFKRFDTVEAAERAAEEKSAEGGVSADQNRSRIQNVWLREAPATAADIRADRQPRYRLFYSHEVDGQTVVDEAPGYWGLDASMIDERGRASRDAAMQDAEAFREDASDRVPGTDRDVAQDMWLDGYGVPTINPPAQAQPATQPRSAPSAPLPTITQPGSREGIQERLDEQRQQLMERSPDLTTSFGSAM